MPAACRALLAPTCEVKSASTWSTVVVPPVMVSLRSTGALKPPPLTRTMMLPAVAPEVPAARAAAPPTKTLVWSLPTAPELKLPSRALAVRSLASTWKAEEELVKPRRSLMVPSPCLSCTTMARTPAFLKAVACCEPALPAPSMAVLMAAARFVVLVTPERFALTLMRLLSEKPAPRKVNSVAPGVLASPMLVESAMILATEVVEDVEMSVPVTPAAWTPERPNERVSTVEVDRSTATLPLVILAALVLPAPPPIKTLRFLASLPPMSRPMVCACRSISVKIEPNSLFSTAREPENVPVADCVAKVRARSINFEMLFKPPSTICNWLKPSLALRMPCVMTLMSLRKPLAMAKPAASSPLEVMRRPEVTREIVFD